MSSTTFTDNITPIVSSWLNDVNTKTYNDPNIIALAASTGSSLVGHVSTGTGAVARTVQSKLRDVVSVKDFGAVGDGVTDDTVFIQAAHDSLGVSGGTLYFPNGVYLISSITISKQCVLQGSGMSTGGTVIKAKNSASNVFNLTGTSISIRDMGWYFGVVQTGGAFINISVTSSIVDIQNVAMDGWFVGIVNSGGGDLYCNHLRLKNGVVTTGTGIQINAGGELRFYDVIIDNASGSKPATGISVISCLDLLMVGCQWIHCITAMLLKPGASNVCSSIYAVKCFFDNSGSYGLLVQPASVSGVVQRGTFSSCWFSSSGSSGILLDTNTIGGVIDGITFSECEVFLNGSHGINIAGVGTKSTRIAGSKIAQNTGAGILINASVSNWQITNNTIGTISSLSGNTTYGVQSLAGTSDDVLICDNQITGNTTAALSIGSTGSRRRISNNNGYNPVGANAITVTASPFTFTANDTPTDVYINGGAITVVTVDGLGVLQAGNYMVHLEPNKSVVVTYTVAPSMAKYVW